MAFGKDFPPRGEDLQGRPNPFADDAAPTPSGDDNPYAAPEHADYNPYQSGYEMTSPHRGGTILTLGILGLVACIGGTGAMFCCCFPFNLVSLIFSLPAWILGRHDLAAMDIGAMDPSGRSATQTGSILGLVSTVIMAVLFLAGVGFVIYAALTESGPFNSF